jgi:hypothetical protein
MGILDIFKNKWSAGEMTQEDRKKIFWYLKRKTSYTAWKREADAFDRFADIFEKQVREEPLASGPDTLFEPMNWEERYPEIIQGQVFYEQGLNRLKRGDRSVWLHNSESVFRHALKLANTWRTKIVFNGEHGDNYFPGMHVEDMKLALNSWYLAHQDTGYFAPSHEASAYEVFEKGRFDNHPYPAFLHDVPEPEPEVLIRSGEEVSIEGIYEPQIKDGCMNYLSAGVPAFTYGSSGPRPVTWKLIWEDNRYLDGHISNEEALYFPPQAKPAEQQAAFVSADLITASTGQTCPKDGHWAVMNDLQGKATFKKGDKMPQHQGRDVVWVWGG